MIMLLRAPIAQCHTNFVNPNSIVSVQPEKGFLRCLESSGHICFEVQTRNNTAMIGWDCDAEPFKPSASFRAGTE